MHLIEPLGFAFEDRHLRRAGLDYTDLAEIRRHPSLESCLASIAGCRVFACSTRGARNYTEVEFRAGDAVLFGPETRGLPPEILDRTPIDQLIRIPMRSGNRSLNLSNAAAVVIYEAWRQRGFAAD